MRFDSNWMAAQKWWSFSFSFCVEQTGKMAGCTRHRCSQCPQITLWQVYDKNRFCSNKSSFTFNTKFALKRKTSVNGERQRGVKKDATNATVWGKKVMPLACAGSLQSNSGMGTAIRQCNGFAQTVTLCHDLYTTQMGAVEAEYRQEFNSCRWIGWVNRLMNSLDIYRFSLGHGKAKLENHFCINFRLN